MNARVLSHSMPKSTSAPPVQINRLQRKCACGGTPGPAGGWRLQRKSPDFKLGIRNGSSVPPIVPEVLLSPGQPIEPSTRAFMEAHFGHDFSKVRVHTDARAAESASAVQAMAYTVGHEIVFGAGRYAPGTSSGQRSKNAEDGRDGYVQGDKNAAIGQRRCHGDHAR